MNKKYYNLLVTHLVGCFVCVWGLVFFLFASLCTTGHLFRYNHAIILIWSVNLGFQYSECLGDSDLSILKHEPILKSCLNCNILVLVC